MILDPPASESVLMLGKAICGKPAPGTTNPSEASSIHRR
jgi:hypothetical protein